MLASFLVIAAMCKLIEGVAQQVAVNTKFHSYALNNFGQYNMRYKAIEASTKVRTPREGLLQAMPEDCHRSV
jgi:hypothetical protein